MPHDEAHADIAEAGGVQVVAHVQNCGRVLCRDSLLHRQLAQTLVSYGIQARAENKDIGLSLEYAPRTTGTYIHTYTPACTHHTRRMMCQVHDHFASSLSIKSEWGRLGRTVPKLRARLTFVAARAAYRAGPGEPQVRNGVYTCSRELSRNTKPSNSPDMNYLSATQREERAEQKQKASGLDQSR